MVKREQLQKVNDYQWQIPPSTRPGMLVPAYIFASENMLDDVLKDRSMDQLMNTATLPGIQKAAMVMPDVHEGYGFPIGGIAATIWPGGVISPGGIGYDINCGVRLLVTDMTAKDVGGLHEKMAIELYQWVPSGVGEGGEIHLSDEEMDTVLTKGARWAVEKGYGQAQDLEHIESGGCLPEADPSRVSAQAKKRGRTHLGTIGSGNHFLEVDRVDTIFNAEAAETFGIRKDQIVILIHTGSRGLGHQVATDYLKVMMEAMPRYKITVPDRELACVPFNSEEGQSYFKAMNAAANFAWCNRQVVTANVRKAWEKLFGGQGGEIKVLYDVAHNIAKVEEHPVNGEKRKLIVHRKGATRAFGPDRHEVSEMYRHVGQPVLIPGSMGTASYVLVGTNKSMEMTFGSSCHGAGRRMSRRAASRSVNVHELENDLIGQGIYVRAGSRRGVSEEAPVAYKDIDLVIETVHQAGIALKVAKLRPIAVVKG